MVSLIKLLYPLKNSRSSLSEEKTSDDSEEEEEMEEECCRDSSSLVALYKIIWSHSVMLQSDNKGRNTIAYRLYYNISNEFSPPKLK